MKKEYVKPEMLVEEILVETMIATSGDQTIEPDAPGGKPRTNEHREGTWGDLWD